MVCNRVCYMVRVKNKCASFDAPTVVAVGTETNSSWSARATWDRIQLSVACARPCGMLEAYWLPTTPELPRRKMSCLSSYWSYVDLVRDERPDERSDRPHLLHLGGVASCRRRDE